jgi:Flp pilus assembly pilin Flp
MVRRLLKSLLREQNGQDLTEYTLLLGLLVMAVAGLFSITGRTAASVWSGAGVTLASANSIADGSSATQAPPPGGNDHDH